VIAGLVLLLAAGIGAGRGFSPGDVPALEGRPTPVTTPVTASLAQGRPSVLVQALASFDDVWQTINDSYYDPTFGGLDWNAVRAEFRPRAEAARSVDEVRQVIREMLGRLKQSHFVLMSPSSVDDTLPGPAAVAVELRVAPPDIVITHVVPTSPAATAGLRAGEVLVAIDGRLASDWMKRMAVEAANTRLRLFEIWKRAFRELHGASGSIAVVRVRGQDGRERDVRVTRSIEQGLPVGFGNLPPVHVRVESAPVTTPRGRRAGLIAFNLWMPQIDVPFAQAIDKFRAADGLVIDLRGNPGGLAGLMVGISGHFIAEPSLLGETRTRENKLTFRVNPRFSTPDGRAVTPFAGPVAILVDELSASATECFAGALQSLGRVRVFGRQTMGQALPAMTKRLATGDVLMYALGDFVTSTGRRLEGDGVIPDEVVPLSIAGLAAGRDATLDAALAWLDKAPLALQPPLLLSSSDLHVRNSTRVRRAHLTQE
jgi:carboxyl-terminal processing protease